MTRKQKRIRRFYRNLVKKICAKKKVKPPFIRNASFIKTGGKYWPFKKTIYAPINRLSDENLKTILHELGHHLDTKNKSTLKREYFAEHFAFSYIKEYFPKRTEECLNYWEYFKSNRRMINKFPDHYNAFKKIYEGK